MKPTRVTLWHEINCIPRAWRGALGTSAARGANFLGGRGGGQPSYTRLLFQENLPFMDFLINISSL